MWRRTDQNRSRRWRYVNAVLPLVSALALTACTSPESTVSSNSASTSSSPATTTSISTPSTSPSRTLQGKVIGIDPGHNGRNFLYPNFLNHQVFNGRTNENCDTTGTSTSSGYSEALFNFRVARYLRADLITRGARVVMTRNSNAGVGPCITRRAHILNNAHVDVAIDIHADGAPAGGQGFAILEPVADGPNNHVIASSLRFARDVRQRMINTLMPVSNYDGANGLKRRSDLAGLNLATEPKVLIECGNMANATDASLLTSELFQRRVAAALTVAITDFLTSSAHP